MHKALFFIALILTFQSSFILAQDNKEEYYKEFNSGDEAIKWWSRLYAGLILSKEEKDIIYDYTFGNFFMINDKLREGVSLDSLSSEQQEKVRKLDEALSKTIIFENLKTYRYERLGFITRLIDSKFFFEHVYKNGKFIEGAAERYLATLMGKHYKDYGFMSTTLIRNAVFQDRVVELIIKVPRLNDAMFVSMPELAAFPTQYELLFPRNRILKIESVEISKDRRRVSFVCKMQGICVQGQECKEPLIDNLKQPGIKDLVQHWKEQRAKQKQ
ncbi:ADP-ribosyltransferase [uncultured Helicobacter sp.]|uniref:ADP-ribosyltransferase n=1 Tax=uncultured Helicobacter sp. TaxID=175537 RepID=UPI00374F4127